MMSSFGSPPPLSLSVLRNSIMALTVIDRQRLCNMLIKADKKAAQSIASFLGQGLQELATTDAATAPTGAVAPSPPATGITTPLRTSATASSSEPRPHVLSPSPSPSVPSPSKKATLEIQEARKAGPLERSLPVGLKANAPPAVGGRLHNSQGDKPWNWKGKADRQWLDRRVLGLHTGNPCLAASEEDLEGMQGMFGEEEGPYSEGGGSFGTLFKARRKADGQAVVVKVLRVSRSSYHKEIFNEICMHETLCQHPQVVGYH